VSAALSRSREIDDVLDRIAAIEASLRALKINNFTTISHQRTALNVDLLAI